MSMSKLSILMGLDICHLAAHSIPLHEPDLNCFRVISINDDCIEEKSLEYLY